jgi:hypothetical protein
MRVWPLLWLFAACGRLDFTAHTDGPSDGPTDRALDAPDPPHFIQHNANTDMATSLSAAFAMPVAAGDLIVAALDYDGTAMSGPNVVSVTDTLGDSYGIVGPSDGEIGGGVRARLYIGMGTAAASDTVTVTATLDAVPNTFFELRIHEYSAASLDGTIGATGGTTGPDGATAQISVTRDSETIFAMIIDGTVESGTGFVARGNDYGDLTEDAPANTPGDYLIRATPTSSWTLLAVGLAAP